MRRAAKVDANQAPIVSALARMGVKVFSTASLGDGFPDLLLAHRGNLFLAEVKAPKGTFTEEQLRFYRTWPSPVYVLRSVTHAISFANGDRHLLERWVGGTLFAGASS